MLALLEAERAGHAAAAGVEHREVEAELAEQRRLVVEAEHGLLVAVAVDDRLGVQRGHREVRRLGGEELAEQKGLLAQPFGVVVSGQHVHQLVAKDRHAARLEADDADAGADLGRSASSTRRSMRRASVSIP